MSQAVVPETKSARIEIPTVIGSGMMTIIGVYISPQASDLRNGNSATVGMSHGDKSVTI